MERFDKNNYVGNAEPQTLQQPDTLESFVLKRVKDGNTTTCVLNLLNENGISSLDDYQINITSSQDLTELIGLDGQVANMLFPKTRSCDEEQPTEFWEFVNSRAQNKGLTETLLATLKELGIENEQSFFDEISNIDQMVEFCQVSREVASLFFENIRNLLSVEEVQALFPITYLEVFAGLKAENIQSLNQITLQQATRLQALKLKEYQILRLLKFEPELSEKNAVTDFLNTISKDKTKNEMIVKNLLSEGALFISTFEQCTEEELLKFGLIVIQIKKIKKNLPQNQGYSHLNSLQNSEIQRVQASKQLCFEQKQATSSNDQQLNFPQSLQTSGLKNERTEPEEMILFQEKKASEETSNEKMIDEIKNLISDYESMPQCFVKKIIQTIEQVAIELYGQKIGTGQKHQHEGILNLFEELTNLQSEEPEDCSDNLKNIFTQLQSQNWKQSLTLLQSLWRKTTPLNLQYLFKLVQKVQNSSRLLSGQDVILLMGETGVGKSTTIHLLAGSKFFYLEKNGLPHFQPTQIRNKSLEQVVCSPFSVSETRYITPVVINLKELGLDEDLTVVLCDCPGFDDSAGQEVDIANSIGTILAAQNCRSVRPVILQSQMSIGDRGAGIKHVAKIISGMIPTAAEHINSFSYFFSKFPQNKKKQINSILVDILSNLNTEDKMDVGFTQLLKDMIRKTKYEAKLLDPLNEDFKVYLEDLIGTYPIKHPREAFEFFISEKSQSALNDQRNLIRLRVRKYLELQKFSQIKYYLDELKVLAEYLKMDQINHTYEELVDLIKESVNKRYNNTINQFNKCFKDQNQLTQEDVIIYQEQIIIFESLHNLRIDHLSQECPSAQSLVDNVRKQLCEQVDQIKVMESLAQSQISLNLQKIRLTTSYFKDFEELYTEIKYFIMERFHDKIRESQSFIDQFDVNSFLQNCHILRQMIQNVADYVHKDSLQDTFAKILEYFIQKLAKEQKAIELNLTEIEVNQQNLRNVKFSYNQLLQVKENLEIYSIFPREQIMIVYEQSVNKIMETCERLSQEVLEYTKDEQKFEKIQNKMEIFQQLRDIQEIEQRSSKIFYLSLEYLTSFILTLKSQLDQHMTQLQNKDSKIEILKFKKCLRILTSSQWIKNFKDEAYSEALDHVKQLLVLSCQENRDLLEQLKIDLENPQNLKPYEQTALKLKQIESLLQTSPNIQLEEQQQLLDYDKFFVEKVNSILKYIQEEFSIEKFQKENFKHLDFSKLEKAISFTKEAMDIKSLQRNQDQKYANINLQLTDLINCFQKNSKTFIMETLQGLINYIDTLDDEEIIINIQNNKIGFINQRINDINNLYRHEQIYQIYTNEEYVSIMKEIKLYLNKALNNLEDKMTEFTRTQNYPQIDKTFFVARIMTQMDEFMNEGRTFQSIYSSQQKEFYNDAPKLYKEIIQNFENKNYLEVSHQIMNLEQSSKKNTTSESYLKKAKSFIYTQLESLLEQTFNKVKLKNNNMSEDKLEKLVSNLKDVDKALTYLEGNIEANLLKNLDQKKGQIQSVLVKTLNEQLQSINTLINIRNFEQVSIQLEKIDNLMNLLDNYCPPEVEAAKNDLINLSESELKLVKTNYEEVLKEIDVYKFTQLKPINLFKQLNNDKYQNIRLILENNIRETYQRQVDQLKKQSLQSWQEKTKELDKIEKTVKYLPQSIIDEVKDIIQALREHLMEEFSKKEQILDELVQGKQYDNLLSHLKKDDLTDPKLLQKLKEFIRKKMSDFHENIKDQIVANNTKDALHSILPLFEFKQKFVLKFSAEIQIEYPQIQATFATLMDKVQGILIKTFVNTELGSQEGVNERNLNDSSDSIQSTSSILQLFSQNGAFIKQDQQKDQASKKLLDSREAFQIFFLYLNLKTQHESKDAFQEMFQQIEKPVSNVLKKINDVVQKEKDIFIKSLSLMHVPWIKKVLKTIKNWGDLLSVMTDESNQTIFLNADVKNLYVTINEFSYQKMLTELENKIIELKTNLITQLQEKLLKLKKEMDDFYQMINLNLNKIKDIDRLKEYQVDVNFSLVKKECFQAIDTKISHFISLCEGIFQKRQLVKEDLLSLGHALNNLSSISQNMIYEKAQVENAKKQLEQKLQQKIEEIFQKAMENTQPEPLSQNLIHLKLFCDNLISFKEYINDKIEEILKYQTKNNKKVIVKLGILLDLSPIGKILISEYKTFSGVQNQLFNSKAQRHSIGTVLESLNGDQMDKDVLLSRYKEFDKEYKDIIKWYIIPKNFKSLGSLIADTKNKAGGFTQHHCIKWDQQVLDSIPVTTAHIFALYTLQNASSYFDSNENSPMDYLFTPHPAQIISIFRLLGLGYQKKGLIQKAKSFSLYDENTTLQNNLIQIGTGEGKSVTLAVASSILALSGFEVYCACYSSYLSKRDFKTFSYLFDSLNITQKIHYGTFNEVCERLLNNRCNIRQKVREFISSGTLSNSDNQADACLKVLLIDEVDVFLNKEFYGNIYSPSLILKDGVINNFTNFLWASRTSKIDLYQVQSSEEYKAMTSKYRGWDDLIIELTKEMILCLQNFESHTYVVNEKENKIGYQLLDSITYNAVQSYNTLFAYYLECTQKKTIAQISLEENIFLSVRCGEFSYAAIPKEFQKIMGVTGTLQTLTEIESGIIRQQYGIRKRTYIPSVFGKNNLKFGENDIYVENQEDYFNVIRREIYSKLNPDPSNGIQRAVLVFFESAKKLLEFFNSQAYDLQDLTNYLTEQANADEKDTLIKNATNVGQITFLTRSFGRGTDFIVRDEVILNNGGIHVIQTFLSEELSEEVQIQGRTARQGNTGSYSMILLDQSLELFGITIKEIEENNGKLKKLLIDKRNQYQLQQQLNNKDFIEQVQNKHDRSHEFLKDLQQNNIKEIKNYLKELNKGPQIQLNQTRTLCLIDATGSMGTLLSKVKTTVHAMFERASQTLTEGGYSPDSFLLKFAVYRNYPQNESQILVASGWESSPLNLREFIQNISAYGGDGPGEAVEIGFQFAELELQELKEKDLKIDQILVIGDAPSNTAQETLCHRKKYHGGESYWGKTKFNKPGDIQQLVTSLRGQNVITNAFYLTDYAKQSFIQIANWGGGLSQFLDINSNKGSEDLTNLVTVEILRKVGNQSGSIESGEKLVQAYKSKYLSYTS